MRSPLLASTSICVLLASSGCGIAKDTARTSLVRAGAGAIAEKLFGAPEPPPGAEGDAADGVTTIAAVRGAEEKAQAESSGAPEERGPGFYKVVEPNGTVRFVSNLSDVPTSQRSHAERLAIRPAGDARKSKGAPSRHVVQQLATAKSAPPTKATPSGAHEVVIYTTSWCGWCKKTRAWLDEQGVDYENRDVEANAAWAEEMHGLTGSGGVPVVVIDGEVIKGFNQAEMEKLLRI